MIMRDLPRWRQTILVVEDDADLREVFAKALNLAGFRVQRAADGVEALRAVDVEVPDLVVLDLLLPMLDGLSVRDELLAHVDTQGIPIVIVTGAAERFAQKLGSRNGECVLTKPVTPASLVATVRHCLNRSAQRGSVLPRDV